jgi:hypothetical protein
MLDRRQINGGDLAVCLHDARNAIKSFNQRIAHDADGEPQRACKIGRPGKERIDTFDRGNVLDIGQAQRAFNLHDECRCRIRLSHVLFEIGVEARGPPGTDAAASQRSIAAGGNDVAGLGRGLNHRDHDTGGAGIECGLHLSRCRRRGAEDHRHLVEIGCRQECSEVLGVDGGVLRVEQQEVEAHPCHQLDDGRIGNPHPWSENRNLAVDLALQLLSAFDDHLPSV